MDKKDKIIALEKEIELLKEKYQHMLNEYSSTREGSAYGVEYYDIQLKVLTTMIEDCRKSIIELKKSTEN